MSQNSKLDLGKVLERILGRKRCIELHPFRRHLESVRPLFDDREYEEMAALSREFETSMAPRLQRYIHTVTGNL